MTIQWHGVYRLKNYTWCIKIEGCISFFVARRFVVHGCGSTVVFCTRRVLKKIEVIVHRVLRCFRVRRELLRDFYNVWKIWQTINTLYLSVKILDLQRRTCFINTLPLNVACCSNLGSMSVSPFFLYSFSLFWSWSIRSFATSRRSPMLS